MSGVLLRLPGLVIAALVAAGTAWGHGSGVSGSHVMDWHGPTVSRVVSPSFGWNNLGATVLGADAGSMVSIEGRACMRAFALGVDVRDSHAFDIAEPVELTLIVDRPTSAPGIAVMYDRVGGPGRVERTVDTAGSGRFVALEIPLPASRFANRGDHGTDLLLASAASRPSGNTQLLEDITVCDIRIERSFTTPAPEHGWLDLVLEAEDGSPTPARVGLYDATGRMPVPSDGAVPIRKFDDLTRTYLLPATVVWPHDNRFVFWIDGRYRARIPAGDYRIVATKGPEYRMLRETVAIRPDATTRKTYRMKRDVDMPARGWFSGDVHIHNSRESARDGAWLLGQTGGEDLHVANLLQMGNVARTYFPLRFWGRAGRYSRGTHALVSGQEDPRTMTLGHTIHLNLEQPVRFPGSYLDYRRVFEAVAAQGGVSGFAHASGRPLEESGPAGWATGGEEGMAVLAATGGLDFAEIMQSGEIGTRFWFAFLNLGYRLAPAAGTDYPYIEPPGAVRSYVETPAGFSVDAWFSGLEQGRTFVTNGPMLGMTLNGQGIGSEVRVVAGDPLELSISATLNPDLGVLTRLEILRHGEIIAEETSQGARELALHFSEPARESAWYVARARGHRPGHDGSIAALTAPVYVVVDGQERVWKRREVPAIAGRLISMLEAVKHQDPQQVFDSESWDTHPVWAEVFPDHLSRARAQIEEAQEWLRGLAETASPAPAPAP